MNSLWTALERGRTDVSYVDHAIVWMDHSDAKVYRFGGIDGSEVKIHTHTSLQRLHHGSGGWEAGGNPPQDGDFFHRIVATLDHTAGIVLTGPGNAKSAFKTFIDDHRPDLISHVVAVDTADHGEQALLALGRHYFSTEKYASS